MQPAHFVIHINEQRIQPELMANDANVIFTVSVIKLDAKRHHIYAL